VEKDMGLTVKKVEKLLRDGVPGKHTDGAKDGGVKGLMLCIENKSSAAWTLRWQKDGRVRHMGLGSADDLPLGSAREKARELRERIALGTDPLEVKAKDREAKREAEAKRHTFKQAAAACHEMLSVEWTNAHHAAEFINSLERYAYPIIGSLDIGVVGQDEVLRVLKQKLPSRIKGQDGPEFWQTKTITADRVRNRIERVLDYATAHKWRTGDNPARWKGFLATVLPKPRKVAPVEHMRSVPYAEVPVVMSALAADQNVAAQAMRFIILTGARLSEAIEAPWSEVDFEAAEWRIPASRMKARRPHTVPLAEPVISLLRSLYREDGNPFLFVSASTRGTHVVEGTVTAALRNAGCQSTIHGFRSCFKTWAEERTASPGLVIEMSLAHAVGSAVERSYRRGILLMKRRKLMEAWAAFCTTPPAAEKGKVLTMKRAG
jgi:integrase